MSARSLHAIAESEVRIRSGIQELLDLRHITGRRCHENAHPIHEVRLAGMDRCTIFP